MKKYLLSLPFLLTALGAHSQPYLVAGYGATALSHNETLIFSGTDNTVLKPTHSDATWFATLGYRFSGDLGIEFRYNQFEADASKEIITQFPSLANNLIKLSNNWKADLRAKQIAIKPVYFFDLNDKFSVKAGAGLSYTKYEITGYSYEETDHELADFDFYRPIAGVINPKGRIQKEVGVIASLALDYNAWNGFFVGLEADVNYDNVATSSQIFGTLTYKF